MRMRADGSVQSANTPTWMNVGFKEDYNLYRCMVTKVFYVDDPLNITKDAQNPEVVYQVVILGGERQGQNLTNVRLGSDAAGETSYNERTLRACSKPLSTTKLSDQDGDMVLVQFIQAHQGYPIIISFANGIHSSVGTKKADAPRSLKSYNGVTEWINNQGEYSLSRFGGTLDTESAVFTPNTAAFDSQISLKNGQIAAIQTAAGGKVAIQKDKIAIGANGTELLQKISDSLDKLITWANTVGAVHTHIGDLGYDTSPPNQASDYQQLGSDLSTIKSAIDGIKGSL